MNMRPVICLILCLMLLTFVPQPANAGSADLSEHRKAAPDQELSAESSTRATAYAELITARMLEGSGKMREALGHYLAFLQKNEGEPELVAHIAEMTMNYQGLEAAVKLLEDKMVNATSPQPYENFVLFCLSYAQEKNELTSKATVAAEQVLKAFPKDSRSYITAVRLQLATGKREAAAQTMEQAAKLEGLDSAFWLGLGRIAQEVWPPADQEKRAEHLAKINPYFEKALQEAPKNPQTRDELLIADYFLFSNQIDRAVVIAEAMVKRDGNLDARKRVVRLYDALERHDDSFHALEDLVKAFPDDVEHRRLLAAQYTQKRDIPKAVEQLEAALQIGGGDLNDYLQISSLLRFVQEPDKFDHFTVRAQQLFPAEPRVTYFRALALNQLKKHAESAKLFDQTAKQAETMAPELLDDNFHFAWGVALERSAQFDAAEKQFEKSINLTPADDPPRAANTMNYLGYMWLEQGRNLDKAEQLIRKANEMEQNNAAYIDSLGWVLFKQGRFPEALAELLKAESLMEKLTGDDAEVLDHIAQTYDKLGRKDKATEYWKRALDLNPETESIKERIEKSLGISKPKPEPKPPADEKEAPKVKAKDGGS